MMTPEQYRESLRDGRVTYLDGRRVLDVTAKPLLRAAIDWVADGYARFYSPEPDAVHPSCPLLSWRALQERAGKEGTVALTHGPQLLILPPWRPPVPGGLRFF